ncbi:MAG: hypothetical protein V4753_08000 [Pseudomonadota bacterium]
MTTVTAMTAVHQHVQSKNRDDRPGREKIAERDVKAMLIDQKQQAHGGEANQGQLPTGRVPLSRIGRVPWLIVLMHCSGSQDSNFRVVHRRRRLSGPDITPDSYGTGCLPKNIWKRGCGR